MTRALAIGTVWLALAGAAGAAELSLLTVRIEDGRVTVLSQEVRPGRFKGGTPGGNLEYRVTDGRGEVLAGGQADLPERVEYPAGDGTIGVLPLGPGARELVLRMPHRPEARKLRLFRRAAGWRAQSAPELLGEAEIPQPARKLRAQAAREKLFPILTNGPVENRLNFVVLGDGFQAHEEQLFTNRAAALLSRFLDTPPYAAYRGYFNAWALFVPSNESGSDRPSEGVFRDTYFNSTYESYGIDRLLTIPPNDRNGNFADGRGKVTRLLADHVPEYDVVAMLVNDTKYGGSGGVPAVASLNGSSAEIAIHELGHSFAGLGDEYESPGNYPDIEEPNTTRETRRAFIKWRDWIEAGTPVPTPPDPGSYGAAVGLFEGAHYHATGWYRPELDCTMRSLGAPFCAVCGEALVLACHARLDLIERVEPEQRSVSSSVAAPARLSAQALGDGATLRLGWTVNSVLLSSAATLDFGTIYASPGTHLVTLAAAEETPLVRNDPRGVLRDAASWSVTVVSGAKPAMTGRVTGGMVRFDSTALAKLVLERTADFAVWAPVRTNLGREIEAEAPLGGAAFYRARAYPAF